MKKFIVCKNNDTKRVLLEKGFKLLKEDSDICVFLNERKSAKLDFSNLEISTTNRLNF
jgi:hypothetical protein